MCPDSMINGNSVNVACSHMIVSQVVGTGKQKGLENRE